MKITHLSAVAVFAIGTTMNVGSCAQAQTDSASAAISELFQGEFVRAWTAQDAQALADLWAEDGDWSSLIGSRRVFEGRADVKQVWEIGLQGRDSAALLELSVLITNVKVVDDRFAVVDLVMKFAEGTASEMREAFVMVLIRETEGWKVLSARAVRLSG